MHEVSLCKGILRIIEEQALTQKFNKVKTVFLEIGTLANVEIEALRFAFPLVIRDSIADQAELRVIEQAAKARCLSCSRVVEIRRRLDPCPHCGGLSLKVTSGDGLQLKELEVE